MAIDSTHIRPVEVTREPALERCKFFADVQLWPLHSKLDPDRWLDNFTQDEMPYAIQMLHSFLYFSELMVDQLFTAAFAGLNRFIFSPEDDFDAAAAKWADLRANVIITSITRERPSEADSGYVFIRKARQVLGIQEKNLFNPENALREAIRHPTRCVIFLDDFVGSGEQCVKTWKRLFPGLGRSFEGLASSNSYSFYYAPLVSTQRGYDRLKRDCKGLAISAAHVIPDSYSLLAPDSVFWPDSLRGKAFDVIRVASARAGIRDTGGAAVDDWQGFHKLGLGLAFYHSVPDATLPIFYWDQNGWRPLVRRT